MLVKNIKNWECILLDDRGILKKDLKYFNSYQLESFLNLEVIPAKTKNYYKIPTRKEY